MTPETEHRIGLDSTGGKFVCAKCGGPREWYPTGDLRYFRRCQTCGALAIKEAKTNGPRRA